ncbi:MAG: LuxR C-terminal-related transcriptional regulator [Caldilinea sp.]
MTEHNALPTDNPLSEREMEVARLLATGASNAEIARDLVISPHTVKVHLRNIFEKLQVSSRTEASMMLVQRGWIVVPGAVVEAAEEATPPPLPEPASLTEVQAHVTPWQRIYLVGALAVCVLFLVAPYVGAWVSDPIDLLTSAGQSVTAPPALQLDSRWQVRTPLRQPTGRHAMVNHAGYQFVVGGETSSGVALDTVTFFDPQRSTWITAAALPAPLANLAAATLGDFLYVAGGSRSQPDGERVLSDRLLGYNQDADQWQDIARLPYPVAGAALVADESALYLIGGWDGHNMRDEIWRLPVNLRSTGTGWELVGHLARGRAFLSATTVRGDIYIAGGFEGERELELFERFTPLTGEIRELASMAAPRGGLALVYDGVALYALGGGWTSSLANLERYDLSTNSWSNFPSPIEGEWRHLAAVGADGQLYITGGWVGDYIDSQLQYQSSFRALLPVISND